MRRVGTRFTASVGWNRDNVRLQYGNFTNDLVPMKVSYSFTRFANLEGLLQYNRQAATFSSNKTAFGSSWPPKWLRPTPTR